MPKIKIFLNFILTLFLISIPAVSLAQERLYSGEASVKIGGTDVAKTVGSVLVTDLSSLFSGGASISIGGNPVAKTLASVLQNSINNSYLFGGEASLLIGGMTVAKSKAQALLVAVVKIFGDIYFKDASSKLGLGVTQDQGVGAAANDFLYFEPPVKFENYTMATWNAGTPSNRNDKMTDNIKKLMKAINCTITANTTIGDPISPTIFNLNPITNCSWQESGRPADNSNRTPDGQIWYFSNQNGLTLNNVTFQGKGTIIVNGNLNVNGNIYYSDLPGPIPASAGFIVCTMDSDSATGQCKSDTTNVNITNNVSNLVGAYFIPNGTFDTNASGGGGSGLNFTGSIVTKDINIDKSRSTDLTDPNAGFSLVFNYDPKVATSPPPGFKKFVELGWSVVP